MRLQLWLCLLPLAVLQAGQPPNVILIPAWDGSMSTLNEDREEKHNLAVAHPAIAEDLKEIPSDRTAQFDPAGLPGGALNEQETRWYLYCFGSGESPAR